VALRALPEKNSWPNNGGKAKNHLNLLFSFLPPPPSEMRYSRSVAMGPGCPIEDFVKPIDLHFKQIAPPACRLFHSHAACARCDQEFENLRISRVLSLLSRLGSFFYFRWSCWLPRSACIKPGPMIINLMMMKQKMPRSKSQSVSQSVS